MTNYQQSGPASFDSLLAPLPKDVQGIARRLRQIIRAAIPEADEAVSGGAKIGMVLYSIGGSNNVVCGIQPTQGMCKLFFHEWNRLNEAGCRLEGSGKHARHIKIRLTGDIQPGNIAEMIQIVSNPP